MDEGHSPRSDRNLTIVNIVIVVFVAVVLLGPLLIVYLGQVNMRAVGPNCLGQLRQIGLAMKAYANDDTEHQYFPYKASARSSNEVLNDLLVARGYVQDIRIFRCTEDKFKKSDGTSLITAGMCSYSIVYSSATGVRGALRDDGNTDTPILADSQTLDNRPHGKKGQNVFYADGHATWRVVPPTFQNPRATWLNPAGY
jgi:prepilin-type processing-associated H-X9-DG protein